MRQFKHFFAVILIGFFTCCTLENTVRAAHIPSGEIHWECITSGPDSGKFIFYLTAYRDCSINTTITDIQFTFENVPGITSITSSLLSQTDATPTSCGLTCDDEVQDISLEKFVFASDPVSLPGPPPPEGYTIYFETCCLIDADNLVNGVNAEAYYSVTMYPFNGQNTDPCFDSSPQFAEQPGRLGCSGNELRYNSNALDPDLDSLSYQLVSILTADGEPMQYAAGFSPTTPLPGPDVLTLDPVTGQFDYNSDEMTQGRYAVAIAVDAWRCGQRISRTIRNMTFSFSACNPVNNTPSISAPTWVAPGSATGYAVTVQAGDLVNFTITGTDNDLNGADPQVLKFSAVGKQFGNNFTDPSSGCIQEPCATLSSVVPPTSGTGSISTTFNWQTDCKHVSVQNECVAYSSTFNFLFRFEDDYCPTSAVNIINVAVTVVGDPTIPSPQPHCVSLNAAGDAVTLTWEAVTDNNIPLSFVEYAIFHSTSPNGSFQEIGAVTNINSDTYLHDGSNGIVTPNTSGANYYYIRTRSGCEGEVLSPAIDTVSSIFLTLTDNGATADLSWTALATPPLASSTGNGTYEVWRQIPPGVWEQIATTQNLFYTDPVVWCVDQQVNYRIELGDNLPCTSVSNEEGAVLSDLELPSPQPLDSVSVDPLTGLVTICWPPSATPNVTDYRVSQNPDENAWDLVATVNGYNNTCWTDPTADPSSASLWYRVAAVNCNGVGVSAGSSAEGTNFHRTIWLQDEVVGCQRTAYLEWTPYWYWAEGVKEYEIYSSKDGSPYVKIATVTDSVLTYTRTNLEEQATYCHFVRAVQNRSVRVTASSNATCSVVEIPKPADYGYHHNATVVTGNTGVQNSFFVDNTAEYLGFEIQRGTDPLEMNFQWFVDFDPTTEYYVYTDNSARPERNSYYYSVIGIDNCDLKVDTLNMVRTMLLEVEAMDDRTNILNWNSYEGWRGSVIAQNIYRNYNGTYQFLTTVPANQLTYTDPVIEIIMGEGNFCYYIEAVEGEGPTVGPNAVQFEEISLSNESCAKQRPNVFVPNAFMPEGVNKIFKPVNVYVEFSSYLFQVYNRWGERVFESTHPSIGWDGTTAGIKSTQGAYAYFISFTSATGATQTKSGTVTLIR